MEQLEVFEQSLLESWKVEEPVRRKVNKCHMCDEKIDLSEDDYEYDINGNLCCNGCYESSWEYASTLVHFYPNNDCSPDDYKLDENFGNISEREPEFPTPIKRLFWHSSSAWRGYMDWELDDGYITAGDGWVTGLPDESTSRKIGLSDMYEKLINQEISCPVDIYWMFGRTSNCCSTASSIIIAEKDKDTFTDWLKNEFDYTIEDIEEMFS